MPDATFLSWPFFDDAHRALAPALETWAATEIALHANDERDVDALSTHFVRRLGLSGWLGYCVPKSHGGRLERLDARSLCLIRETLARGSGLADFAFAMQGLVR